MKIAKVRYDNEVFYGLIEKNHIKRLKTTPFTDLELDGRIYDYNKVSFLAPCQPSKVVAVGVNYKEHAVEMKHELPQDPIIFLKPSTVILDPEAAIKIPCMSQRVDYEGELAVVISKTCKDVTTDNAMDYVLGFTCFNDVTARDLQRLDGQWTRAKSFDTFGPLGPWIETNMNYKDAEIITRLNGEVVQKSRTSLLIHPIEYVISYISQIMTLYPGDIIATGTPSGIGPVHSGDCVEVFIENIGTLKNPVE